MSLTDFIRIEREAFLRVSNNHEEIPDLIIKHGKTVRDFAKGKSYEVSVDELISLIQGNKESS